MPADDNGAFAAELTTTAALELDDDCRKIPRARQVYDGLIWRITRQPDAGPLLQLRDPGDPGAEIRMVKSKLRRHLPTVMIIYRVKAGRVTVVKVKASPSGYDPTL